MRDQKLSSEEVNSVLDDVLLALSQEAEALTIVSEKTEAIVDFTNKQDREISKINGMLEEQRSDNR